MKPTLLALGGGGFSNGADPAIDDLVLRLADGGRQDIGFIGWASGDDPLKLERFYDRFAESGLARDHLPLEAPPQRFHAWTQSKGAIYFGGGNTLHLLDRVRRTEVLEPLRQAWRSGTLIAGVSAGAIVWFDEAFTDAGGNGFAPLAGLGFVPGSCCPHYSSEPERRPAFQAAVARGQAAPGLAIDDGVAVVVTEGRAPLAFSARPAAWAYRLEPVRAGLATTRLAAM